MPDTIILDSGTDVAYRFDEFSTTQNTSFDYSGLSNQVRGASWDGTNLISCEVDGNLLNLHDEFTSTVSTSIDSPDPNPIGISWDGTDLLSNDNVSGFVFRHDGFSASIDTSIPSLVAGDTTWDGTNLILHNQPANESTRFVGFSATIGTTIARASFGQKGCSWDGTNYMSIADPDTVYLHDEFSASFLDTLPAPGNIPRGVAWTGNFAGAATAPGLMRVQRNRILNRILTM